MKKITDNKLKELQDEKKLPDSSFSEALSESVRQSNIANMVSTNSGRERLIKLGIDPLYLAAILLQQIEEDIFNDKYKNKTQTAINSARSIQVDLVKSLLQYSYNKEEIQRALDNPNFTPVIIQLPDLNHHDNERNKKDSVDREQFN
jgi:hypothetical protein